MFSIFTFFRQRRLFQIYIVRFEITYITPPIFYINLCFGRHRYITFNGRRILTIPTICDIRLINNITGYFREICVFIPFSNHNTLCNSFSTIVLIAYTNIITTIRISSNVSS